MASVDANAHEQPKWLRRLSWCSYCLRIAACRCRVSTRVTCATGHAPVRPLHARLVVGAIVAQHEEDLPVYYMQWMQS